MPKYIPKRSENDKFLKNCTNMLFFDTVISCDLTAVVFRELFSFDVELEPKPRTLYSVLKM